MPDPVSTVLLIGVGACLCEYVAWLMQLARDAAAAAGGSDRAAEPMSRPSTAAAATTASGLAAASAGLIGSADDYSGANEAWASPLMGRQGRDGRPPARRAVSAEPSGATLRHRHPQHCQMSEAELAATAQALGLAVGTRQPSAAAAAAVADPAAAPLAGVARRAARRLVVSELRSASARRRHARDDCCPCYLLLCPGLCSSIAGGGGRGCRLCSALCELFCTAPRLGGSGAGAGGGGSGSLLDSGEAAAAPGLGLLERL